MSLLSEKNQLEPDRAVQGSLKLRSSLLRLEEVGRTGSFTFKPLWARVEGRGEFLTLWGKPDRDFTHFTDESKKPAVEWPLGLTFKPLLSVDFTHVVSSWVASVRVCGGFQDWCARPLGSFPFPVFFFFPGKAVSAPPPPPPSLAPPYQPPGRRPSPSCHLNISASESFIFSLLLAIILTCALGITI